MNESLETKYSYQHFLDKPTSKQWNLIGAHRRSGVCVPLFSIYSDSSAGIGELPDIRLLVDWCNKTGVSIIQLLPLNDVGFNFSPYDAESSFAIDPMYLSLRELKGIDESFTANDVKDLNKKFPSSNPRVNYDIKGEKLRILWDVFGRFFEKDNLEFNSFVEKNASWLEDYALFKLLKYLNSERGWESWDKEYQKPNSSLRGKLNKEHEKTLLYYKWLQWQLYEQFIQVKEYASQNNVLLMGDMPFLVSRNSVDVWANQDLFRLDQASGSPPDFFLVAGQRWGMPPYNWGEIKNNDYKYLISKLNYAENFYDLFRIDHAVGLFRLWTIPSSEPHENAGKNGVFEPQDESKWEEHGREIINVIIQNTKMLPCAEDLGTIPECSPRVLEDFGIPGMDIQRWLKTESEFNSPDSYRVNSISSISTHDTTSFLNWFSNLSKDEAMQFKSYLDIKEDGVLDLSDVLFGALSKVYKSRSIFSIQLIHDLLGLDHPDHQDFWLSSINDPGTFGDHNWTWKSPYSLNTMMELGLNSKIRFLNKDSLRKSQLC